MPSVDSTIQLIQINEQRGSRNQLSTCSSALADAPWTFDAEPTYGPGASMADHLPATAPRQPGLPAEYRNASPAELDLRIRAAKHALGDKLVILGHFYQRDEIVQYADFVGDSFQLANAALTRPNAETIVFCGVHFMAETADMLSRPDQAVILPNLAAGCSMADMADLDSVTDCWEQLTEVLGDNLTPDGRQQVIPVTYMNSSAALKGFCGEHGGVVCTSSNAARVLEWAFERGQRVLFFPTSTSAATPPKPWASRFRRCPSGTPTSPSAATPPILSATPASSSGTASAPSTSASPSSRLPWPASVTPASRSSSTPSAPCP